MKIRYLYYLLPLLLLSCFYNKTNNNKLLEAELLYSHQAIAEKEDLIQEKWSLYDPMPIEEIGKIYEYIPLEETKNFKTYIDYSYEIILNGIYFFTENYELLPIYINTTDDPFNASYQGYQQYENILVFYKYTFSGRESLVYDFVTGQITEINIGYIDSIKFITKNKLLIAGKIDFTDEESTMLEIDFENRNTSEEIIGQELEIVLGNYSGYAGSAMFKNRESIDWELLTINIKEGGYSYINSLYDYNLYLEETIIFLKTFGKNIVINYKPSDIDYLTGMIDRDFIDSFNINVILIYNYINDR